MMTTKKFKGLMEIFYKIKRKQKSKMDYLRELLKKKKRKCMKKIFKLVRQAKKNEKYFCGL